MDLRVRTIFAWLKFGYVRTHPLTGGTMQNVKSSNANYFQDIPTIHGVDTNLYHDTCLTIYTKLARDLLFPFGVATSDSDIQDNVSSVKTRLLADTVISTLGKSFVESWSENITNNASMYGQNQRRTA